MKDLKNIKKPVDNCFWQNIVIGILLLIIYVLIKGQEMKDFNLHFGGFYHSIHDQFIDSMLESYFSDDEGESVDYDDKYNINYQVIFKAYSKAYLNVLETVLYDNEDIEINLSFNALISPREYNFSTDIISTGLFQNHFEFLLEHYSNNQGFIDYVNKHSKSYDGFASFFEGYETVKANNQIWLEYLFKYLVNEYQEEIIQELDCQNIHELIYQLDFYTDCEGVSSE